MVSLAQVGSSDKGRDMERPERDSEREMYGLAIDMTDLGEEVSRRTHYVSGQPERMVVGAIH